MIYECFRKEKSMQIQYNRSIMDEREQKRYARLLRLRRERRMKLLKISASFLAAFCIIIICAASYNVLDTHANDGFKYYTSVTVEVGDSLWQIAGDYIDSHYNSRESYIAEVRSINHLADNDTIYAGQILIVPYFSSEYVN